MCWAGNGTGSTVCVGQVTVLAVVRPHFQGNPTDCVCLCGVWYVWCVLCVCMVCVTCGVCVCVCVCVW